MTITNFLIACSALLILSVIMSVRSIRKKGGMMDIQNNQLLDWEPFDFLEKHFNIPRMQRVNFIGIFKNGIREDYFYLSVADKISLDEKNAYIFVRKKISIFEKKWIYVLWLALLLPFILRVIPIQKGILDKFIDFMPLIVMAFALYKLRSKPYKDELLLIQKNILQKMYAFLYNDNFFDKIELEVRLTKFARARVPSNYYDLPKIISQINEKKSKT
ncbi:MAG: hypothetical protein IPJ81_09515 [Chitinophagaceae bacterium]|nr:hypothetical protein [Chitinophagaceae bacterium]